MRTVSPGPGSNETCCRHAHLPTPELGDDAPAAFTTDFGRERHGLHSTARNSHKSSCHGAVKNSGGYLIELGLGLNLHGFPRVEGPLFEQCTKQTAVTAACCLDFQSVLLPSRCPQPRHSGCRFLSLVHRPSLHCPPYTVLTSSEARWAFLGNGRLSTTRAQA